MNARRLLLAVTMSAVPTLAVAGVPQVPEPETLALLGIGAIALVISRWRKKK
jgi:hypothetical protein